MRKFFNQIFLFFHFWGSSKSKSRSSSGSKDKKDCQRQLRRRWMGWVHFPSWSTKQAATPPPTPPSRPTFWAKNILLGSHTTENEAQLTWKQASKQARRHKGWKLLQRAALLAKGHSDQIQKKNFFYERAFHIGKLEQRSNNIINVKADRHWRNG